MNTGTVKQASGNPIKISQRIVSETDATNHVASDMELEANENHPYYRKLDNNSPFLLNFRCGLLAFKSGIFILLDNDSLFLPHRGLFADRACSQHGEQDITEGERLAISD